LEIPITRDLYICTDALVSCISFRTAPQKTFGLSTSIYCASKPLRSSSRVMLMLQAMCQHTFRYRWKLKSIRYCFGSQHSMAMSCEIQSRHQNRGVGSGNTESLPKGFVSTSCHRLKVLSAQVKQEENVLDIQETQSLRCSNLGTLSSSRESSVDRRNEGKVARTRRLGRL
jgi:hypothetical protein